MHAVMAIAPIGWYVPTKHISQQFRGRGRLLSLKSLAFIFLHSFVCKHKVVTFGFRMNPSTLARRNWIIRNWMIRLRRKYFSKRDCDQMTSSDTCALYRSSTTSEGKRCKKLLKMGGSK
ncbi:hypothetical protein DVB69_15705 [Sporosarcina sp. BI001-red]|nr:hypothetical protein DVB69_15705 [Sporosarcina sp. BI001-red]